MTIEKMAPHHVPQIAALEAQCFSDPWSENSIASELKNPLSLWLVALEEGEVAGYIGSQTVPPESDMMNVAVAPAFRRRGIGEALVLALCEELAKAGSESITLEVRDSNTAAISLYEKLGFTQVGLRKNYYHNPREDARILKKLFCRDA